MIFPPQLYSTSPPVPTNTTTTTTTTITTTTTTSTITLHFLLIFPSPCVPPSSITSLPPHRPPSFFLSSAASVSHPLLDGHKETCERERESSPLMFHSPPGKLRSYFSGRGGGGNGGRRRRRRRRTGVGSGVGRTAVLVGDEEVKEEEKERKKEDV
ncbi:hypothetical protein E2C01_091377 [Portunus trituberculatus]|uniref:Uncharacterized protein n=1 Tax=Portunus trituberculatus TaxID=210409 RepID=A0A5B7JNE7_PORTR|nr:hypothetical protein [Portunus trituberculatus]